MSSMFQIYVRYILANIDIYKIYVKYILIFQISHMEKYICNIYVKIYEIYFRKVA